MGQCSLKHLYASGKRFESKIALRAHHARKPNLERQTRIGRRAKLGIQIAQDAQNVRQAIDPKHTCLARHSRKRALRSIHRHGAIGKRKHIQVAHIRRQIAHEMRQIGARFNIFRNPGKARRRIALRNMANDIGHIVHIERAEHVVCNLDSYFPVTERNELLEHGERVAHSALRPMRHQIERIPFEIHALGRAYRAQARDDLFFAQAMKVEPLASRLDGFRNLLRIGRAHDENNMARRFFKRLKQRIEGRNGEHVHFVDDINLVATARGRILNAADNLLAHVIDARAACRIELIDVGVDAGRNGLALLARAVGRRRWTLLAQKRFGKQASRRGLTRSSRPAKQVSVANFILLDGVFERTLDMGLAHDVFECLRAIFAV